MLCYNTDKEQAARLRDIMNGPVELLRSSPKVKALGYDDMATIAWLYKKANPRSHWDPHTIDISENQVGRFWDTVKVFVKDVGKKKSGLSLFFKLPRALARWFPEGDTFVSEVIETTAYNQRHIKEAGAHIGAMTKGLFKMLSEYSDGKLSEKDLKLLRGIESRFESAKTYEEKTAVLDDVHHKVGNIGDENAPALGKILRRFTGLLAGVGETKPLQPDNAVEEKIVHNWNLYRAASIKDLLSGSINAKRLLKFLNDGRARTKLTDAVDRVQEQIDALLIQSNIDSKIWTKDYKIKMGAVIEKDGLKVYNPKTKKHEDYMMRDPNDPTKKVVAKGFIGYNPRYVLELTDMLSDIINKSMTYRDAVDKNLGDMSVDELVNEIHKVTSPEAISNRLKQKGETNKYFSLDPVYYLNKYAHDVASFNTSTRIHLQFAEHTKDLLKRIRKSNTSKEKPDWDNDIGVYTGQLVDMLFSIRDNAIGQGKDQQGSMDQVVRMINAFEYVSKMGFGIKSSFKNLTQWMWNYHEYGARGIASSIAFHSGTSREWDPNDPKDGVMTNAQMVQRQLKRFGMMIGDKVVAANIAAITGGSIDVLNVPKGFDIDPKTGQLFISNNQNNAKKLLKESARVFSIITEYASKRTIPTAVLEGGMEAIMRFFTAGKAGIKNLPEKHKKGFDWLLSLGSVQWSENLNRLQTFKIAFANAFEIESSFSRKDYHKRQIILEKGERHVVTKKELYDRIERTSGNVAREMISIFHYDYDNWAKSRILRGKTGRVGGQYQHFTFAYFDMMHNYVTSARDDLWGGVKQIGEFKLPTRWFDRDEVSGKYININPNNLHELKINPFSHNLQRMTRVSMTHSLLPGIVGAAFNIDIGGIWSTLGIAPFWATEEDKKKMARTVGNRGAGLIEDPVITKAKQMYDWLSADYDYNPVLSYGQNMELKERYQEKKHGAFYGKNPITGNLGPLVSDIFTFADLMDLRSLTPEEFEKKKNMVLDIEDPGWRYNMMRIFNVEAARWYKSVAPNLLRGHWGAAVESQFGAYAPAWQRDWRKKNTEVILDKMIETNWLPPGKRKSKKLSKDRRALLKEKERQDALNALGMIQF